MSPRVKPKTPLEQHSRSLVELSEAQSAHNKAEAKLRDGKFLVERTGPARREAEKQEQRDRWRVSEADMYGPGRRSFLRDLILSAGDNTDATYRLTAHHDYELRRLSEIEQRAVTAGTLGGFITPSYLVDLYAKAARNGRVYADQVNGGDLPSTGMSVIFPRLTAGLSAGVQATESSALTTSDPTETDLSVPVRTIGAYSPVSFQALDRGVLVEEALFEDAVARYFALLDSQCISGSGASGQILGVLNTSGIATSTAGTADAKTVLSKIEDVTQQIENSLLGVAGTADKIVMHPRRFRWLCAQSDVTNNRPMVLIEASEPEANEASTAGYVGRLAHLSIYIDPRPEHPDEPRRLHERGPDHRHELAAGSPARESWRPGHRPR